MSREKFAWVTSVVLVALLALQLPGTLAHRDDDYAFVGQLLTIHRQVADSYVEPVDEDKLRAGAINGMLSQLDPYTVYVPPSEEERFDRLLEGSYKGVGIQLDQDKDTKEIEVITPIEDSPAQKAGVLAGDILLAVNGESVRGVTLEEVMNKIKGPLGSEVRLKVRHLTGEEVELSMTRQEIVVPTVKGYARRPDNTWDYFVHNDPKIAYVRITQFTPDTAAKVRGVLEQCMKDGMKGLVMDLRFNPGGRLDQAKEVVDLFLEDGTIVVTRGRNRPEEVAKATKEGTLPNFPMAVLVNEHSASASEIVAGSLMDNRRAQVVGTRTYGKGSVQEVTHLERGGELKMTVAYYYLPSGRLVHQKKGATDWGVNPNINVPMDEDAQRWLAQSMEQSDLFRRPVLPAKRATTAPSSRPASRPATTQASTKPATQYTDTQLEAAVTTMVGQIVLKDQRDSSAHAQTTPVTKPPQ